jgi:hypothetical protein
MRVKEEEERSGKKRGRENKPSEEKERSGNGVPSRDEVAAREKGEGSGSGETEGKETEGRELGTARRELWEGTKCKRRPKRTADTEM